MNGTPPPPDDGIRLYKYREVANRLGVTERWVGELIRTRQLGCVDLGRYKRVSADQLQAYVDGRRRAGTYETTS